MGAFGTKNVAQRLPPEGHQERPSLDIWLSLSTARECVQEHPFGPQHQFHEQTNDDARICQGA